MDVLFEKLFMNLLLWVLRLVDDIFGIFKQLAGIDTIKASGEDTDVISVFLNAPIVTKVFMGILVVAVVVCAIAMITAIVKAFINMSGGERKSIAKITGQGLGTIFISLAMAGIMISGIFIANSMLREVHNAFNVDDTTISREIFDIAVDGYTVAIPIYDDPSTDVIETEENPVWQVDDEGNFVYDAEGNKIAKIFSYTYLRKDSGWNPIYDGKMPNENIFNLRQINADEIYGNRPKNLIGLEDSSKSPKGNYFVELGSFNYLIGYFAGVIILVAVASACLGLVKRLYDIVILFLSLPLIVATIPLDDGARFKVWRDTVISKVVIAYGAVFAVNVFLLMVPIIKTFEGSTVLQMLLLVGGGLSISGGILLFARLFGTDAAESRDLAQSARTLLAGGAAAAAGVAKVGKIAGKVAGGAGTLAKDWATGRMTGPTSLFGNKSSAAVSGISSNSLTPAAMPGSSLGEALRTAGVKTGTWAKDPTTGRFMSSQKAQELLSSGALKKAKA